MWGLTSLADASAGVGDANENVTLGVHPAKGHAQLIAGGDAGREGNGAAVRHGVARVDAKVEKDLMDLTPVRLGEGQTRLELENKINCLREGRLEHAIEFLDKHVQVERGEAGLGLAGRGQKLLDERGAAGDGVANDLDRLGHLLRMFFQSSSRVV